MYYAFVVMCQQHSTYICFKVPMTLLWQRCTNCVMYFPLLICFFYLACTFEFKLVMSEPYVLSVMICQMHFTSSLSSQLVAKVSNSFHPVWPPDFLHSLIRAYFYCWLLCPGCPCAAMLMLRFNKLVVSKPKRLTGSTYFSGIHFEPQALHFYSVTFLSL